MSRTIKHQAANELVWLSIYWPRPLPYEHVIG